MAFALAFRPSKKSGQLRNCRNDPKPAKPRLSYNRVSDPPNFTECAPLKKLKVSLSTKLFCVSVRGITLPMATEPRIPKLGSSLFRFISLSNTPTSDHLKGASALHFVICANKTDSGFVQ